MELGLEGQNFTPTLLVDNGASGDVQQPREGFPIHQVETCAAPIRTEGFGVTVSLPQEELA